MINRGTLFLSGGAILVAAAGATYLGFQGMGSMADYNASVAETRAGLKEAPETRDLIRYATLAANSHNTQPWRFKVNSGGIEIIPDLTRCLAAVDPDNHHLFTSLGCAAENLSIAAAMRGKPGRLSFNSSNGGTVSIAFDAVAPPERALFDAIPKRQSTRDNFDGRFRTLPVAC